MFLQDAKHPPLQPVMSNIYRRARTPAVSSFALHCGPTLSIPIELHRCSRSSAPEPELHRGDGPSESRRTDSGWIMRPVCQLVSKPQLSAHLSLSLLLLVHPSVALSLYLSGSGSLLFFYVLFGYFRYHITTVTKGPSGG